MNHSSSFVGETRKYLEENAGKIDEDEGSIPLYLIITFGFASIWGNDYTIAQQMFKRKGGPRGDEDPAVLSAFSRFLESDSEGKNEQFKFMFRLVEGIPTASAAITTLGGERPVLIGKRLTTEYYFGKNYMEIFLDVGSSYIASMLKTTMLQTAGSCVLDMCYLLEGQKAEELPERMMANCRWNYCEPEQIYVHLDEKGERSKQ